MPVWKSTSTPAAATKRAVDGHARLEGRRDQDPGTHARLRCEQRRNQPRPSRPATIATARPSRLSMTRHGDGTRSRCPMNRGRPSEDLDHLERDQIAAEQSLRPAPGCPAATGQGRPVCGSHWHDANLATQRESRRASPCRYPRTGTSRRIARCSTKVRGFTASRSSGCRRCDGRVPVRPDICTWGGVPAASHAQLCLIGWGWNQRWDQAAIGSWGESICYEPEGIQVRCMIDDVRPLMVWSMARQASRR